MCKYCEVKPSVYSWDTDKHGDIICSTNYENCNIIQCSDNGNFHIRISGSYEDFSEEIFFCPFCGRKLKD